MAGSDTTDDLEADLGALLEGPPGLGGTIERAIQRLDHLRQNSEFVAFACVVLLGIAGISAWVATRDEPVDVAQLVPEVRLDTTVPITAPAQVYLVHVTGAVSKPGVYSLEAGARVIDAIAAAGGATAEGLVHELNLAGLLADGMQIRVPVEGEVVIAPSVGGGSDAGPVDINSAAEAELERLVGIGPSLAKAIVAYRAEHGPYGSADDLVSVPGIGPAKVESLRDQIVVR